MASGNRKGATPYGHTAVPVLFQDTAYSPIKMNSMAAPEPNSEILFSIEEPHLPWTSWLPAISPIPVTFLHYLKEAKTSVISLKAPSHKPYSLLCVPFSSKIEMFALF